jgi:hypothetical protein
MGIHAARRRQHGTFSLDPGHAQTAHSSAAGTGRRQLAEVGSQRIGAAIKERGIHIAMRASVGMADKARLWVCRGLELQARGRKYAKALRR